MTTHYATLGISENASDEEIIVVCTWKVKVIESLNSRK